MKLAFTFTTKHIYYVAISGAENAQVFYKKERIALPVNHEIPDMVGWFETQLESIIQTLMPNIISYKLTINNVSNNYVSNVYYGQAILNLLCHKKGICIKHISPTSIVASKFNKPKGTDLHKYLDELIGIHPPYWDKTMKDTALIAIMIN